VRFHVLGPLDVRGVADQSIEVTSAKHRALLSVLLLESGRVVSVDRIVDQLWGETPPVTAVATLQTYVSQLRRLLEPRRGPREAPSLLVTRSPGYALHVEPGQVDARRLPDLVTQGTRLAEAGDLGQAEALLDEAIRSWRGLPYADLAETALVQAERNRLEEILLTAHEQVVGVRIGLGRADLAVAELESLVAEHPLRERLWARLMEGLWATGRQADALAAYQRCAQLLRDELGLDPGPELARVHEAVLRQELPAPVGASPRAGLPSPAVAEPALPGPPRPAAYGQGAESVAGARDARPLVGRVSERDLLRAALGGSTRGAGSVLVIEGEAGIGKTRLAEEATAMAEAQGWRSAWARCADDAGAPALWPWSRLLEQLGLGELRLDAGDDPDRSRFALFQDVRARLQEVSTHSPLLIVLDDVQAADDSSLQLLSLFASHLEGVRVLVVVTVRSVGETLPEPVQECLARLTREPRALRLRVSGLGEDGVRELLEAALGPEGAELAHQIHARTEGNPFFVGEFARLIRSERPASPATGDGLVAVPALPPSVREVLGRRLDSLPETSLALLRLGAVAGQEYDLPLLQAAWGVDPEAVLVALEPAIRSGVVVEREPGWEWRFDHALIREILLAGLSRIEAARLHHRIALTLEARGHRTAIDVGRLAHHYLQAVAVAGPEPAIAYATLAADAARARFAHPEAADLTRRALRLLEMRTEGEPGDTERQRHTLLVALATDLLRSGEPQQAQGVVRQALAVARCLGDGERLAEAAAVWSGVTVWNWRPYGVVDHELVALLESLAAQTLDDALRARILGTLAVELAYSERLDDRMRCAEQAVELVRGDGDVALLGQTLNNFSLAMWGAPDQVRLRLAAADESIALSGRGLPARTEFCARLHRAPLRLHLGDVDGFEVDLAAAARIAETLPGPEVRPLVLYQQTGRAMLLGQWEEAEALSLEAYDLYRRTSMWGARMCQVLHEFTLRRREGRTDEVVEALVEVGDQGVALVQTMAVIAAAEAGDLGEARRLRARWPQQVVTDWTTDSLIVARAWLSVLFEEDVRAAYDELLPYRGRQVVVGTANAGWGSYDAVLSDLATALGDRTAAVEHARSALAAGRAVRSPWQVRGAEARLATLLGASEATVSV
jgi:DNA-binding SARP family transcriptional activator